MQQMLGSQLIHVPRGILFYEKAVPSPITSGLVGRFIATFIPNFNPNKHEACVTFRLV